MMDAVVRKEIESILETQGADVEVLNNISKILSTGLDRRALAAIIGLLNKGIDPEAIADGIMGYYVITRTLNNIFCHFFSAIDELRKS